jgi:peptidoglycan/xylan/chitin deacetylase (PgdA/CDA1 family)
MKKVFLALCLVLCLLLIAGLALAEDASVSFTKQNGSVNGGFPFTFSLTLRKAVEQDLDVLLQCKETGEELTVHIPSGSKEGTVQYETDLVTKNETRNFTIQDGEGYTAKSKNFALKVVTLPKAKFYNSVIFGYVGKTTTVNILFENPSSVLKGTTVQLRDQNGTVLDEKTWNSGDGLRPFKVNVTRDLIDRRVLSVWMGDYKISEKYGYGAFTDMSDEPVRKVATDQPLVAITLDCGWYGRQMPDILPILEKNNVHCTFFMTGFFIRTFTQEARDAVAAGHEIGNHTNLHPKMAKDKAKINRVTELTSTNDAAVELLGVRPRLFRPPYGDYDREVIALSRAEGMEIIIWTEDSHDWDVTNGYDFDKVWKRVTKKIEPGYILLFHLDGKSTPAVLEKLLPYIQEELGYKCVTVSELLASANMRIPEVVEVDTGAAD